VEELIDFDQVDKALKAVTFEVNFMVLALTKQCFLDLSDGEAIVFLVDFDIFLGFVSFFGLRVEYSFD
jgi:hypothetical protein